MPQRNNIGRARSVGLWCARESATYTMLVLSRHAPNHTRPRAHIELLRFVRLRDRAWMLAARAPDAHGVVVAAENGETVPQPALRALASAATAAER